MGTLSVDTAFRIYLATMSGLIITMDILSSFTRPLTLTNALPTIRQETMAQSKDAEMLAMNSTGFAKQDMPSFTTGMII